MGKSRPNRRNKLAEAASPTGLQSVKQAETEKSLSGNDISGLESVLEKLTSPSADDKIYGCTALALYISNKSVLEELIKRDAIRTIATLLTDNKVAVQTAAANLIRTLSEAGGFEACEQMVRHDLLSSLSALLKKRTTEITSGNKVVKKDYGVDSFTDVIMTVQNLCECTAVAVKVAVEESLPNILLHNLSLSGHLPQVYLAAAQCLYTLSEENELVADLLKNAESTKVLTALLDDKDTSLYVKVIVSGILMNACNYDTNQIDKKVLDVLDRAAEQDSLTIFRQTLQTCCGEELAPEVEQQSGEHDNGMDEVGNEMDMKDMETEELKTKSTPAAKKLEELEHVLQSQKLSFEILTNLTASDDTDVWEDADEDDSGSEVSGSTDVSDMADDEEMDQETAGTDSENSSLSSSLLKEKVLPRLQFIDSAMYGAAKSCDKTYRNTVLALLDKYNAMLSSVLICLNNTIQRCGADGSLSAEKLYKTVTDLISKTSQPEVASDECLLESMVSAIRGLTERIVHINQTCQYEDGDMNTLHNLTKVNNKATAIHALRTLSAVGTSLSKASTPNIVIKSIGKVLMEVAMSSEPWIAVESLDALMDVFGEDVNNQYIKELNLLPMLRAASPHLKQLSSKKDGSTIEFRPVLTTVKTNLPRFIKYKSKFIS